MTQHPTPSPFEARSNATYQALLWALSRPGLVRTLPATGAEAVLPASGREACPASGRDADIPAAGRDADPASGRDAGLIASGPDAGLPASSWAAIVEALIDRECAVHCADPVLAALVARTGAALVGPERADHVFAARLPAAQALARLRQGSDLHPEEGATLVCSAVFGRGERLRLTGPGCDGAVALALDGLPPGFWQERARIMRYPAGFEIFLTDGAWVIGVPRSTTVEVL